jgi:hypothetical protein
MGYPSSSGPRPHVALQIAARSDRTYRLKLAIPSELLDPSADLAKLRIGGLERWLVIRSPKGERFVLTLNEEELNKLVERDSSPRPAVTEPAGSNRPARAPTTPTTPEPTASRTTAVPKASITPLGGEARPFDAILVARPLSLTERLPRRARNVIPWPVRERVTGEAVMGAAFLLAVAAFVFFVGVALNRLARNGRHGDLLVGFVVAALLISALVALVLQRRSRPAVAAAAAGTALTLAAFAPGHLTAFEHLLTLDVSSPLHASVTVNSGKGRPPATVRLTDAQAELLSNAALKISARIKQLRKSVRHLAGSAQAETRAEIRSEKRIADALQILSRDEP